jgi:hypothetical protein
MREDQARKQNADAPIDLAKLRSDSRADIARPRIRKRWMPIGLAITGWIVSLLRSLSAASKSYLG